VVHYIGILWCIIQFVYCGAPGFFVEGGKGVFLPHRTSMMHLPTQYPFFVGGGYLTHVDGSKYWHRMYGMPRWGVAIHIQALGNDAILGNAYALYPFLRFAVGKMDILMGCGTAYISRKWDRVENHKNTAMGSSINIFIKGGISYYIFRHGGVGVRTMAQFTHVSNMAMAMPNLGVNYVMLGIGVDMLREREPLNLDTTQINFFEWHRRNRYGMVVGGGFRAFSPQKNVLLPILHAELYYKLMTFRDIVDVSLAMDLFYNTYQSLFLETERGERGDAWQGGSSINIQWNISRLVITGGWGYYLFSPGRIYGDFYHKIGCNYVISPHLSLVTVLHANFFKANFLEGGVKVRF